MTKHPPSTINNHYPAPHNLPSTIYNLRSRFTLSKFKLNASKGFTLIELVIVISIMGLLASLLLTNFTDGRNRANDANKKASLHSVQIALNLYQNSYQSYPPSVKYESGKVNYISGCGTDGATLCPCSSTIDFATGTSCENVYMTQFPEGLGNNGIAYYQCSAGADYRLKTSLSNKSDPDIEISQARCSDISCGLSYSATDYVVCP